MLHAKFSVNWHSSSRMSAHILSRDANAAWKACRLEHRTLAGTPGMNLCTPTARVRRVEIGGSVCESNAPLTSKMPIAGFEDRESHRTPFASAAGRNRWPHPILKPRLGLGKLSLGEVPVAYFELAAGGHALLGIGLGRRRRNDHLVARLPVGGRGAGVGIGGL